MIAFLKGKIELCKPTVVWINCNNVGYEAQISLKTFSEIKDKQDVFLYTHLQIKEDAHTLYGFAAMDERQAFKLLIQVSGIGGNMARTILSSLSAREVAQIIYAQDAHQLKKVKGIGSKIAERLLLELKGKAHSIAEPSDPAYSQTFPSAGGWSSKIEDAVQALQVLGISKAQAENICKKIQAEIGEKDDVESIIKKALQNL